MTDDIQALIQAALSDQVETKKEGVEREMYTFIRSLGIKEGAAPIPIRRVYAAYKKYKKKDFMSMKKFGGLFQTYFRYRKFKNYKYYYLTPEPLGLPTSYTIYTDRELFPKSRGIPYEKARKRREEKAAKEQVDTEE